MTAPTIRICYFGDDLQHGEFVGAHLRAAGFTVDLCNDAISAIEAITDNVPDVILADIIMPCMNGLEAIKQIRSIGVTAPIIILANFERHELDATDLKEMHITKILFKAITSLDDIIKEVVAASQQHATGPAGVTST